MQKMILMVDDDPDDVQFFCSALYETNKPYYCISVPDGEEALHFLNNTFICPDFIFIDLNMPGIDGKECLVEIKKRAQLKGIPVIIYSTTSQKQEIDDLYQLGADYFFTKPCNTALLTSTISDILEGNLWKKRR